MQNDAQLMAEAGVNVVRMAEFAWDRFEPREGVFELSFFDETIERLAKVGIQTFLGTPTAAPPRWMSQRRPEWLRVNAAGQTMRHGSRQHLCTTNPGFRAASRRITRALAEHFSDNPYVIGWQTDNEFNCHFNECHCPACQVGFREWLGAKYGSIDALNEAWGANFWAQTYDGFEQIETPVNDCPTHVNPSQQLDYFRFLSDSVIAFNRDQARILKQVQPNWWVTHNGMFDHLDYWKLTGDLDFLGFDAYPGFAPKHPEGFTWASLKFEECRAATGTFIVPEQQAGPGGQRPYLHETPQPGQMRLWSWQAVARGADGILHFRWRTCRYGAEMYWCGILDHDNVPRRRYEELAQEGAEFKKLASEILGTAERIDAAILVEMDQDEAHRTLPLGLPGSTDQRKLALGELLKRHRAAGCVDSRDSFAGLKWIIVPSFVLGDETLAQKLTAFAEAGGLVIATPRIATRDRRNHVIDQTPPGVFSGLFGVQVEEFGKLTPGELSLELPGGLLPSGAGYEILQPISAEVVARWQAPESHAAANQPAITLRRLGAGSAVYLGTWFSPENLSALWDWLESLHSLPALGVADPCVEITRRQAEGRVLTFVLNHYADKRSVQNLATGTDLITGQKVDSEIELPAYGVAVIRS